jgi:hypothetical protein
MAPFHGARPGKEDARALSFLVQDAGTAAVNGVYVRVDSRSVGTDVFIKTGTQYAILKRSENHWSIADLGGGAPGRCNLRSLEFYRNDRVPGGYTPPDFGWKVGDGMEPSPMVFASKNPNMRLALPRLHESKSAPTLALALATKKKPLDNLSLTATLAGKSDSLGRSGLLTANQPLFGSSEAALEPAVVSGVRGHANFMLCYSIVLTRPSVKVGWGFKWYEQNFQDMGVRDVESVELDSPLHRWNTWQSIRGRPTAVVFPGDRLLRVDGRWQFPELEIGNDELEPDGEILHRRTGDEGAKAGRSFNSVVFDFARKDEIRPLAPPAPMVEVPESDGADALLRVSWGSGDIWHPPIIGWAIIIQDIAIRIWHTVDAYGSARPRHGAQSVRAIHGERESVTVVRGLKQGRSYCACVAVCTEYGGWSPFSSHSRVVCLAKPLTIPESVFEDYENPLWAYHSEQWPANRIPHYVVPTRVVPGATAPVEVLPVPKTSIPVPNTFMDQRRRLRMQVVMPGHMDGLELGLVDFIIEIRRDTNKEENRLGLSFNHDEPEKVCLIVEYIDGSGLISDWNQANPAEVQLRRNDKIMAVNGVSKDAKRMTEVLKEALTLRMVVVRGQKEKSKTRVKRRMGPDGDPNGGEPSHTKDSSGSQDHAQERTLIVQGIKSGSAADRWIRQMDEARFNLHGAEVSMGIQAYDKIISLNGVTGAANMIYEIQRKPGRFAMIVERIVGHDAEGIDWEIRNVSSELQEVVSKLQEARMRPEHLADHPEVKEKRAELHRLRLRLMREAGEVWLPGAKGPDVFEVNSRLDSDAVRLAEEVQWNCLLPPCEGELACSIVSSEMGNLVEAWQEVVRLSQEATEAFRNRPPRYTYPSIVGDAESRILLFDRQNQVEQDREKILRTPGGRNRASFHGNLPEDEDHALSSLKSAIVDVRCDPHELRGAIATFDKASPAVKGSPAAKKMLRRADTLLQIWTWRERVKYLRGRLDTVITEALVVERENTDIDDFDDETVKPYEVLHLEKIIEEAAEFETEMQFDYAEAQEILARHQEENVRQTAALKLQSAVKDPRQDKENLLEALEGCKQADVDRKILDAGHKFLSYLEKEHKKKAAREAIKKAVKGLEEKMIRRDRPGAGSKEQQIVKEALTEAHLDEDDPDDKELLDRANTLVRQWLTSNSVLRPEAKLFSAVRRAADGYKMSQPRAGDLLGSAIAEVADAGVDYSRLEEARETLTAWEFSRKRKAEQELDIAMQYGDAEHLKEAIGFAIVAGITEEFLRPHKAKMERLRYADEIRTMLTEAMEFVDGSQLEKCVAFAHDKTFVETEEVLLMSATMQINLRFWTEEFRSAQQTKGAAEGLSDDVERVEELVARCEELLTPGGMDPEPEIATTCLQKDLRALTLLLPAIRDTSNVHSAEEELRRVLGQLEVCAEELPEVIAEAQRQFSTGLLNRELLKEAIEAKKAYDACVKELQDCLAKCEGSTDEGEAENLKNKLIKAFLAGAPSKDIKKAWKILETQFPELEKYARTELELLTALAEADDIEEKSVESRFMNLQEKADEARKLNPPLVPETWTRVDETSLALAAERTLAMQVASAEIVLSGTRPDSPHSAGGSRGNSRGSVANSGDGSRPGSQKKSRKTRRISSAGADDAPSKAASRKSKKSRGSVSGSLADTMHDGEEPASPSSRKTVAQTVMEENSGILAGSTPEQVEELAQKLANACISAEQSALEEAKKLIPVAFELRDRLNEEAKRRREALQAVQAATEKRQGITKDLRRALTGAREASLPVNLLEEAYGQLREMKVAFVQEDMSSAMVEGNRTLAVATYFRAKALGFSGLQTKQRMTYQEFFAREFQCDTRSIVDKQSMMKGIRCGGSFGTATWRNNPQFAIRFSQEILNERMKKAAKEHKHGSAIPEITVTVAVAEGAESPANFAVHAVRNSQEACAAGARWLLVPGYEVLASSNADDDLPLLTFELPPSDDSRPVFLVPSCPKGEEGPFTMVVEGSNPVDVVEVADQYRDLWKHTHEIEVQWDDQMPNRKNKGGPRKSGVAPELSWYHNPQFAVRLKSRTQVADENRLKRAHSKPSDLVSSFPFAHLEDSQEKPSTAESSLMESSKDFSEADTIHVDIKIFGAGDFEESFTEKMAEGEFYVTAELAGRGTLLFRTEAEAGADRITWNFQAPTQAMMTDEKLIIKFWEATIMGEEVVRGEVHLPYAAFIDGSCHPMASLGLMKDFHQASIGLIDRAHTNAFLEDEQEDEQTKLQQMQEAMTRKATTGFLGKLFLSVLVVPKPPTAAESFAFQSVDEDSMMEIHPPITDPFGVTTDGFGTYPSQASALLQVRVLQADERAGEVPVAVHIVENNLAVWQEKLEEEKKKKPKRRKKEEDEGLEDEEEEEQEESIRRIIENPYYHTVLASSAGASGKEYQIASEVGCVCKLIHGASQDDDGETVIVIPSLESKTMDGKYILQILATEDIIVERVN